MSIATKPILETDADRDGGAAGAIPRNRLAQAALIAGVLLWIAGLFVPAIQAWVGPVMLAWFLGTQPIARGAAIAAAANILFGLLGRAIAGDVSGSAVVVVVAAGLVGLLPYVAHRVIRTRLPGFVGTLALPAFGTALAAAGAALGEPGSVSAITAAQGQSAMLLSRPFAAIAGAYGVVFGRLWFAAVLNWLWDADFVWRDVWGGVVAYLAASLSGWLYALAAARALPASGFAWACALAGCALAGLAGAQAWRGRSRPWASRAGTVERLRHPATHERLAVRAGGGAEALVGVETGAAFPIRRGIPVFVTSAEIVGSNRKYAQLYDFIAGFYDDSEKFATALRYGSQAAIRRGILRDVVVRPGDAVLETSIGTGINIKYLPRHASYSGLDISWGMLRRCQDNLARWSRAAELYHGNAETLPFGDDSFDVVFHVGGFNFFADRRAALMEMIRVAKPGALIVIADETEQHVKDSYERTPGVGRYFTGRDEIVAAPLDLLPPEVRDARLRLTWEGRFYSLSFRKPA